MRLRAEIAKKLQKSIKKFWWNKNTLYLCRRKMNGRGRFHEPKSKIKWQIWFIQPVQSTAVSKSR